MTITEALLTHPWYGYPTNGAARRHTPHVLAVVHQTATTPYDGQAMALRNARNTSTQPSNTATYYVDADGDAVHAVDGTKYASWCAGVLASPDTSIASVATLVAHNKSGFNPNECAWEQIECVGTGSEPWTDAQFATAAQIIAARAKLAGLPINRSTVLTHRDLNTVNRPSDPWPAATREARMARLIQMANAILNPPQETDMVTVTDQTEKLVSMPVGKPVYDLAGKVILAASTVAMVSRPSIYGTAISGIAYRVVRVNVGGIDQLGLVKVSDASLIDDPTSKTQADIDAAVKVQQATDQTACDAKLAQQQANDAAALAGQIAADKLALDAAVKAATDPLNAKIGLLNGQVSTLSSEVSSLTQDVAAAESVAADAKTALSLFKNRVKTAWTDVQEVVAEASA